MQNRRVVITGMGAITPLGASVNLFWDGLISARSGVRPLRNFDCSKYESRVQAYEKQGLTRSDAQGVVEAEDMKAAS